MEIVRQERPPGIAAGAGPSMPGRVVSSTLPGHPEGAKRLRDLLDAGFEPRVKQVPQSLRSFGMSGYSCFQARICMANSAAACPRSSRALSLSCTSGRTRSRLTAALP